MPIGTGNDLSQVLGYGSKMNLLRLDGFVRTILRSDVHVRKFDLWEVAVENTVPCLNSERSKKKMKKYKPINFKKGMLLYLGLGYDAFIIYYYEQFRRFFPLMVISTKISKLYFAFMFFYMYFKSFCRSYMAKLYKLYDTSTVLRASESESEKKHPQDSSTVGKRLQLTKMNNLIILNGRSRAGGFKNEWQKSNRAAVRLGDKNVILKKDRQGNWTPKAELYARKKCNHWPIFLEKSSFTTSQIYGNPKRLCRKKFQENWLKN